MTKRNVLMPSAQGVAPGQTATINLPIGWTYEDFDVQVSANLGTGDALVPVANWGDVFSEVRLVVNGKVTYRAPGDFIADLAEFYGETLVAGSLPILLARSWMRLEAGWLMGAYGTNGMRTFDLEMDIKSSVTAVSSLKVFAGQSLSPRGPGEAFHPVLDVWGYHYELNKFNHTQGATGDADIADIPPRGAYRVLGMHIGTDSISDLSLEVDGLKALDSDATSRAARLAKSKRVKQTGYTHLDFIADNMYERSQPMALQDMRLKPTFTGTGTFNVFVESIKPA